MSLTAAVLVLSASAITAAAQIQTLGAKNLRAQTQNATLFKEAGCRAKGKHCPPGSKWICVGAGCSCVAC